MDYRKQVIDKKRIVIKIGSSSLTHKESGRINLTKLEKLVRIVSDIKNSGKDVVLVSSGAIAVGRNKMGLMDKQLEVSEKQACAAIGQAQLMMIYQKLFSEYSQTAAQILMTKNTMLNDISRTNAVNTFNELFALNAIPIVNENDTVSTYEIQFGDNDRLSAVVSALTSADLLILLSDIDGLFTDDPHVNKDAKFVSLVTNLDDELMNMGKNTSTSKVGTGGMSAKLAAAKIATAAGADMIIANGENVEIVNDILAGKDIGTLFVSNKDEGFDLLDFIAK